MNYFAHGMAYLDQPFFLAGTAVPDWLNVADRKIRLRRDDVLPWADGSDTPAAQFAAGILQHLDDDEWFHATKGFEQTTQRMSRSFREHLASTHKNPRSAFLGHISTELLLDGVLIAQNPSRLETYYAALATVEPRWIEDTVSQFAKRTVSSLAWFVEQFLRSRFLFDYLYAAKLLYRLNQVVRRIKLRPLPESTTNVLDGGRAIVERHLSDLLPRELSPIIPQLKAELP